MQDSGASRRGIAELYVKFEPRHCEEPTGRANARPMAGSATKQSILSLRGAMDCFASLAITASKRATPQSSSPGFTGRSSIPEASVIEPRSRGVLDTPLARGMTAVGGGEHPGFCVIARSEATKQSILPFARRDGLLCGTCHRARVRTTSWLPAMTAEEVRPATKLGHPF